MKKTLEQMFEEFLFEAEFVKKTKPETLRGYKNTFTLFSRLCPNTKIENLNSHLVVTFFKTLQERKRSIGKGIIRTGIKKSTAATYWSKLNSFFTWLSEKGYLQSNPFETLAYPTPSYDDKKFLKKEEVEKIITAVYSHTSNNLLLLKRNLVIIYLLLFCGLRREELLSLQVRDIDLERKLLNVRGESSKSGRHRQVPLHSTVLLFLKDYLNTRKHYTTPYLIVSSESDKGLSRDGLRHLVLRLRRQSGVAFHLHQFRHTFAVNFLHTSNNLAKLQQLLGHRSIAMTLLYVRCLPVQTMREDIETMHLDTFI
jgi:site-specific recombinase XerD